jgi:hypothetical protein
MLGPFVLPQMLIPFDAFPVFVHEFQQLLLLEVL